MGDSPIFCFIDHDNLHITAARRPGNAEADRTALVPIGDLIAAACGGVVPAMIRAYAPWSRYPSYRRAFDAIGAERVDVTVREDANVPNAADIRIAVDIMDAIHDRPGATVVLASGDGGLACVVAACRRHGCRTVVIGYPESMSRTLVDAADQVVRWDAVSAPHGRRTTASVPAQPVRPAAPAPPADPPRRRTHQADIERNLTAPAEAVAKAKAAGVAAKVARGTDAVVPGPGAKPPMDAAERRRLIQANIARNTEMARRVAETKAATSGRPAPTVARSPAAGPAKPAPQAAKPIPTSASGLDTPAKYVRTAMADLRASGTPGDPTVRELLGAIRVRVPDFDPADWGIDTITGLLEAIPGVEVVRRVREPALVRLRDAA